MNYCLNVKYLNIYVGKKIELKVVVAQDQTGVWLIIKHRAQHDQPKFYCRYQIMTNLFVHCHLVYYYSLLLRSSVLHRFGIKVDTLRPPSTQT